ncbi:hypothetical protein BSKO_03342 [Bryopsis sp. KO-2023]|nr:hypothetical protein BSKO_03342 [Bryopsis sp. KO-2023]
MTFLSLNAFEGFSASSILSLKKIGPGHIDELVKEAVGQLDIPVHFSLRPFCSVCKQVFPTEHLLTLHLAESHDSFFAAQAARNMPVFECLVESCKEKFTSRKHRETHLFHHHRFPQGHNYENLHRPSKRSRMLLDAKPRKDRRKKKNRNKGKKPQILPDEVASRGKTKKDSGMDPEVMDETGGVGGSSSKRNGNAIDGSNQMDVDNVTVALSRLRTTDARMPLAPKFGVKRGGSMIMPKIPVAMKEGQFQRQHLPARRSKNTAASGNATSSGMDCDQPIEIENARDGSSSLAQPQ